MARASIQFLLVLAVFLLGGSTGDQKADVAEPKYRLPTNAVPKSYDIKLEPDLEKFTFTGEARIRFTVVEKTKTLTLNAKELVTSTENVSINSTAVVNRVYNNSEKEFLFVEFKEELQENETYELTVKYTGELNDQKRGFYRSRYFDANGENVRYVAATHFEPTGARQAFPCFDEPGYKATFVITLTHPDTHTAIANTPKDVEKSSSNKEKGKKTTVFKETVKMSTYLVAFVVSDYAHKELDGGKFRVWTKPSAVEQVDYSLNAGKKLLNLLGNYLKVPYEDYMDKMDQVSLKDFSAGAMENWGLVTYRESALLYEPGVTTTATKQSITTIIAHEFAHQWFGNLVSPKWWKYIWLNEGFATYFEYFIAHELEPTWRLNETFVVNAMQLRAFVADAAKDVRPINHDADSPQEISKLFDTIAYQKAGSVIRMMSHILTPKVYQDALHEYLTIRKLSNADSDDLLAVMEKVANKKFAGESFKTIMDNWLNKPGYPVVTVEKSGESDYKIRQERFTIGNQVQSNAKDDTKWWVPLTYVKESNPNFGNTTPAYWLEANNDSLVISGIAEKDKWIIFNTQQTGYYRVNYDVENWNLLTKYLREGYHKNLTTINRAQLVDDALNMARASRLNYTVALPLTLYLIHETDYVPWQTALTNLNFLRNMLKTSEHYHLLNVYYNYIMNELTKSVGYEPKEKDDHLTKILRANAMKVACRAKIGKCVDYAEKEFKEWIGNASKILDVDLKNNIICAGVREVDSKVWNDTYNRLVSSTKDEDDRKSLLSLLACSNSEEILKKHLLQTISETNYSVTFDSAAQSIITEHLNGVNIVLDVLIEKHEEIQKLNNGESMIKSVVEAVAGAITEDDQFAKMAKFVAIRLEGEPLTTAIVKASGNLAWIGRNRKTIEKWLMDQEEELSAVSSASSLAFATILVVLSLFITQLY